MPDFTAKQREKLAEEDEAMPDGSYPIRNRSDLKNAIQAFGRSKNPAKTKAWIKKRARELDAEDLLPESWDAEVKHLDDNSAYLVHYGVLGMKWGVRKDRRRASSAQKKETKAKAKKEKTKAQAKKDISKYGSKSKAIKALSDKADKKANAKQKVKDGASFVTAALSGLGSLRYAALSGAAISKAAAAGADLLAVSGGLTLASIGLGAVSLGAAVASGVYTVTKGKRSKKDQARIDAVKKSR